MPALTAVGRGECVDVAIETADDEEIAADARTAGPAQRAVAALPQPAVTLAQMLFPDRAAGRGVDRLDDAVDARRIELAVDDRGREARTRIASAVADALGPRAFAPAPSA